MTMIVKKSPINQGFWHFDIVNLFTKRSDKEYVFLDIETTGFAPANSQLYLIGCLYFSENSWMQAQWLAETFDEEFLILESFLDALPEKFCLVTFNGSTFDIPYLRHKQEQFSLDGFENLNFFDLYKVLKPYKQLLNFSHFRQQDLEKFVDFHRKGDVSAKKCITIYQEFLRTEDPSLPEILLRHNTQDLQGMLSILPLLSYTQLPKVLFQVRSSEIQDNSLNVLCTLNAPLPHPVEFDSDFLSGRGYQNQLTLCLPLTEGKLRKFYADYKDYDYLPGEDMAIHRSLSSYIARDKKKRATAETCYTWFDCSLVFAEHPDQLRDCLTEYLQLLIFGHLIPH